MFFSTDVIYTLYIVCLISVTKKSDFGSVFSTGMYILPTSETKDYYQPVISYLERIQQLSRLPPERGCRNQLVSAWDALFTVSVCWHKKKQEFSSVSPLIHLMYALTIYIPMPSIGLVHFSI